MKKRLFPWLVVRMRAGLRNPFLRATAVALGVLLPIQTFSQTLKGYEIPFESSRVFGLKTIRVEANGKPAVLIVDTASDHTILSYDFEEVRVRSRENAVATSKGSGLTGTGVFATVSLKVGPINWRDHRVVMMDLHEFSKSFGQRIDGLLGADFLNEFELVIFDSKHHKLILER